MKNTNYENGATTAHPEWEKYQMRHYIALIYKDANSDYGVSFPDLPGVITAGSGYAVARTSDGRVYTTSVEREAPLAEVPPAQVLPLLAARSN